MEFFLTNPDVQRLPPPETRVLNMRAEPYPDGKRVRVVIELTPFQENPYLNITLSNPVGEIVAEASIVEPATWILELNLHIRKPCAIAGGSYKLSIILSYPSLGEIDHRDLLIEIPSPPA
jgi:hypothetical protein